MILSALCFQINRQVVLSLAHMFGSLPVVAIGGLLAILAFALELLLGRIKLKAQKEVLR